MQPIITTEQSLLYNNLEKMPIKQLLACMNHEDQTVPIAVEKAIPQISALVEVIVQKMQQQQGRLFYIGAGTSGRLGVLDAAECVPTFGIPHGTVIGVIAGGNQAMFRAVEFAEDDPHAAWYDLQQHHVTPADVVVGIAASGKTPYTVNALKMCQQHHITTACITCNANTPLHTYANIPIQAVVGGEIITGSTRLKAGTAQKLILNMITTATFTQLGKVKDNKMIDMQLTNEKLIQRGVHIIIEKLQLYDYEQVKAMLLEHKSVRKVLELYATTK